MGDRRHTPAPHLHPGASLVWGGLGLGILALPSTLDPLGSFPLAHSGPGHPSGELGEEGSVNNSVV